MNGHPSRDEEFDLYALGVLEGDECKAIEAHAVTCAECTQKLAEAQGRVATLAFAAPRMEPSPSVRARLLEQLHGASEPVASAPAAVAMPIRAAREPEFGAKASGQWVTWVLATAAMALLVVSSLLWKQIDRLHGDVEKLRGEAQVLHRQLEYQRRVADVMEGPNTISVALKPMPGMPNGDAMVHYNAAKGKLVYNGWIEPAPSDKSYQLWVVPTEGSPISVGVFNPVTEDPASWIASVPQGVQAKAFAITLEPAGGEEQPTGPQVLVSNGT
jgi:anti-sigma-K factor RskA